MGDNIQPAERFSAYVVIPSHVFFDRNISDRARLLYGLISSMTNHKGYCWAKNETLARYLGTESDGTVRRLLKELKDNGHIRVEQKNESGTTVRKIYLTDVADLQDRPVKNERPPAQICADRPLKNERQNNININNPPIVPQEGDSSKQTQTHRRSRRKAGQPVSLPDDLEFRWKRFYDVYPVHKDKQKARERWLALSPDDDMTDMIVGSVKKLAAQDPEWQKGAIPHPSTFLNNRRWEDVENLSPQPAAPAAQNDEGEWL